MEKIKHPSTKSDFDAILEEAQDKLVVVDFTATWCGPCQRVAPVFAQLAVKFPQAYFVKVDVDENQETATAFGVTAMPTFKIFRTFEEVGMIKGCDPDGLEALISEHLEDQNVEREFDPDDIPKPVAPRFSLTEKILTKQEVDFDSMTASQAKEILFHLYNPDTGYPDLNYYKEICQLFPIAYNEKFQMFKDNREKLDYIWQNLDPFWYVLEKDEALSTMLVDMINQKLYGQHFAAWFKDAANEEAGVEKNSGPSYYKRGSIDVWDFIRDQNLDFHLGNVIKYTCRAGYKDNNKVEDLKKAIHYLSNEVEYRTKRACLGVDLG